MDCTLLYGYKTQKLFKLEISEQSRLNYLLYAEHIPCSERLGSVSSAQASSPSSNNLFAIDSASAFGMLRMMNSNSGVIISLGAVPVLARSTKQRLNSNSSTD